MTTALAQQTQQGQLQLSETSAATLPKVLTEVVSVPGARGKAWLPSVVSDDEKAAVAQHLNHIEEQLVPATTNEIVAMLTALGEYYGLKASDPASRTRIAMTAEDLMGYSKAHIAQVLKKHRQSIGWFPKSHELCPVLAQNERHGKELAHRARVLLGKEDPTWYERLCLEEVRRDKEQREAMGEVLEAMRLQALPPAQQQMARAIMQGAADNEENKSRKVEE